MSFEEVLAALEHAAALGVRTVASGARLIGHIPHRAPNAYLHIVFPPLGDRDLKTLARDLGASIPAEYEEFLRTTNGLLMFADSIALYGFRTSYRRSIEDAQPYSMVKPNQDERPSGLPATVLVIGRYSADGSKGVSGR